MNIKKINKFTINTFLLIILSFISENNCLCDFIYKISNFSYSNINRKMDNWGFGWNCNTIEYAFKNGTNKIGKIGYKCWEKIEEKPKESAAIATAGIGISYLAYLGYKYITNKQPEVQVQKATQQQALPINNENKQQENKIDIYDDWKKISLNDLNQLFIEKEEAQRKFFKDNGYELVIYKKNKNKKNATLILKPNNNIIELGSEKTEDEIFENEIMEQEKKQQELMQKIIAENKLKLNFDLIKKEEEEGINLEIKKELQLQENLLKELQLQENLLENLIIQENLLKELQLQENLLENLIIQNYFKNKLIIINKKII